MFTLGQRWFSQAEPELGLGIVEESGDRQVKILYPAAQESRIYNIKSAPLKRHILSVGDVASNEDGVSVTIEEVKEQNGIFFYIGEDQVIPEIELKSAISLIKPEEKLLAGNFDPNEIFDFRYETLLLRRNLEQYKARGIEGSRINIIGHQISIFMDALKKPNIRLVLADEVGLGKTIEAGILAKRLNENSEASRILIIAPSTLQYQWFVEMFKKFDMLFKTLGAGDEIELSGKVDNDDFIITSLPHLLESESDKEKISSNTWDLVIVDEAHRYKKNSEEFSILEKLAGQSTHALFLSATPEALGEENFFNLLAVLNPQKYTDFDTYKSQEEEYKSIQEIGPNELLKYNFERDYFRNRRKNLEHKENLFPKKHLNAIRLDIDKPSDRKVMKAKVEALAVLLQERPDKKFFVIGKSRTLAVQVQSELQKHMNVKASLFHGEQTLLERDRQAAYFADPEGARVLISAESGSEGRNFEFASEIFLLDFPTHPQLLLQRIGRLDRIGQKNDITIHAPFVANSPEENLFKLHNEAFGLFDSFPTGLIEYYERNKDDIDKALVSNDQKLIAKFAIQYKEFQKNVEEAKNRFLDAHSYKQENVDMASSEIENFHSKNNIQAYLEKAFNIAGIDYEEIFPQIHFARPSDNMLIPSYPGLPTEGFSYTASREKALKRDDLRFMSFESPLIKGTMDLFSEGEIGNCTAVTHEGKLGQNIYFEFIFKVQAATSKLANPARFFPLTPVRVILDPKGEDLTQKLPKKMVDQSVVSLDENLAANMTQNLPKQAILDLVKKSQAIAAKRSLKYREKAIQDANSYFDSQLKHLSDWGAQNEACAVEATSLKTKKEVVINSIENLSIVLDSLRLIV